jgi:hypothetical protein
MAAGCILYWTPTSERIRPALNGFTTRIPMRQRSYRTKEKWAPSNDEFFRMLPVGVQQVWELIRMNGPLQAFSFGLYGLQILAVVL